MLMMRWFGVPLKLLRWGLSLVGLAALVLAAMIATPLRPPAGTDLDLADGPRRRSLQPCRRSSGSHARDGTELAYRHYPARGAGERTGSPSSCTARRDRASPSTRWRTRSRRAASKPTRRTFAAMAPPARAATSAISASSRTISRISSPSCARPHPAAPLTLIGHSAGGGFALRVAGSPIQNLFARTVLLAPYLGYDAPTNRPDSGGWASADIPRFLGAGGPAPARHRLLRGAADAGLRGAAEFRTDPGLDLFVPPDAQFRDRAATATISPPRPSRSTLIAGAADELMIADKYADAVQRHRAAVDVKLIDGVNHMGIVSDPRGRLGDCG